MCEVKNITGKIEKYIFKIIVNYQQINYNDVIMKKKTKYISK